MTDFEIVWRWNPHLLYEIGQMRAEFYQDADYVAYLKDNWGVDVNGKRVSANGFTGNLDLNYFWGW